MAVVAFPLLAIVGSFSQWRREYSVHSERLRTAKLSGYDKVSLPTSDRSAVPRESTGGSTAGTDVRIFVTFYTVESTDVTMGRMRVKVWMNWLWKDARLAWNPAHYGNITTAYYLAVAHVRSLPLWVV